MAATGTLRDTYVAAIQHDLIELSGDERLVGVVRRPTGWFDAAVDENLPGLAPPAALLDEFAARSEDLKLQGMCDEGAHNAAWDDVDFGRRYRDHLDGADDARAGLARVSALVEAGTDVVLVCYENTDRKRCHRTVLRERYERDR